MIQLTSIQSYQELISSGALNQLQELVFKAFLNNPLCTDREISEWNNIDINIVTARRNELVEEGIITDKGKRECSISGKLANIWQVRTVEEIKKGPVEKRECLSDSEMKKIYKKVQLANDFQKKQIKKWCEL